MKKYGSASDSTVEVDQDRTQEDPQPPQEPTSADDNDNDDE